MRWSWLAVAMTLGTGCQCVPPTTPDDAGVPLQPGQLVVAFDADFGDVPRRQVVERVLRFTNVGGAPTGVQGLSIDAGDFSMDRTDDFVVPAGGAREVTVRFQPTRNGAQISGLSFTPDASAPRVIIPLRGVGVGPVASLVPASVEFGALDLYDGSPTRAEQSVELRNVGDRPLHLQPSRWRVEPAAELCVGEVDDDDVCLGTVTGFDLDAAVMPGASVRLPLRLAATSAGTKEWTVRVFTDDPDGAPSPLVVRADVTRRPLCRFALPANLDFGVVPPPRRVTLQVRLLNVGTEPCTVRDVALGAELNTPPDGASVFTVVTSPALPVDVPVGGALDVVVQAWPRGPVAGGDGVVRSALRFSLNAPEVAEVPIEARVEPTCLLVTPDVDFGTVRTQCASEARAVRVLNTCTQPIIFTSSGAAPGPMTLTADVPAPQPLARWATATFTAVFRPTDPGLVRVPAAIDYTEGGVPRRTWVTLRGVGGTDGLHTERFPARASMADVVVVLDSSGSMQQFWSLVQAQLPTLLTALDQGPLDYRVGFLSGSNQVTPLLWRTSTGDRWLTRTTVDRATELATWLHAPLGHNEEGCLEPLRRAFSAPHRSDPAANGGFLRDDAMLVVLCVSDNADWALPDFEPYFALKPRADQLRVHTITAQPGASTCGEGTLPAPHSELARQTGGTVAVLCQTPWATLSDVAESGRGRRWVFPLPSTPDAQGVAPTVTVGGQPVPATQANNVVWSYLQPPPRVEFAPLWAPAVSDNVEVTYPTSCHP